MLERITAQTGDEYLKLMAKGARYHSKQDTRSQGLPRGNRPEARQARGVL